MINCKYTAIDENSTFEKVVNEKYNPGKTVLVNISARILAQYSVYLDQFDSLKRASSAILPAELNEKQALLSCYSSVTETFKVIKAAIYDNQPIELQNHCPYCLLDRPRTLDHYIAKTEFPEFAILTKNLIPCCYDCNRKKDENWRSHSQRTFIHFYNDNFLANNFLHVVFKYQAASRIPQVKYFLRRPQGMQYHQYGIIKKHFESLLLLKEYNKSAITVVSSEIEVLLNAIRTGQYRGRLVQNLRQNSVSLASRFGVNYWKAVLYRQMADNPYFINNII